MDIVLSFVIAIQKVLIVLFGPGRFFVYGTLFVWIFRRRITDTITFNQVREKVIDIINKCEYGTIDRDTITFVNSNYNFYMFSLIYIDKDYKKARDAKKKRNGLKYEELCDDILYYFPTIPYN